MQSQVLDLGLHRDFDVIQCHRWTECAFGCERNMDRLGLLDFDFPLVEPYLKDVKMVLETLRGDERVSVGSKQSRVIREGDDSDVIRCRQVGGVELVEQGA